MVSVKACSVPGCEKPARSRSMCRSHRSRVDRTGKVSAETPIVSRLAHDYVGWLTSHIAWDSKLCLIWPYSCAPAGYGRFRYMGKYHYAHRFMCTLVNGPHDGNKDQATHSCGNGHLGCVHPQHLRWATRQDNQMDRVRHGTSNRGEANHFAVLCESEVRWARSMAGQMSVSAIARQLEVSAGTIAAIFKGRSWAWLQ